MAETVADIALQLGINRNDFNRQLQDVQNTAQNTGNVLSRALTGNGNIPSIFNRTVEKPLKSSFNSIGNGVSKLGGLIAGEFALSSIKEFVSECLELGSDLAEVQNVVDVTFTSMSDSVNKFSKDAMSQFGLSKTVAKKYMGTFGAMSKAFGFTEEQSYAMTKSITGLTADVSSFYNISTDEAYTKMKSIWTGETESLKDLGVVMTQTALDTINTNVIPILQSLGDKFNSVANDYIKPASVANDYIKPALEDIINTFGNIVNEISVLIDTTIKPIVQWVIEKVVPPLSNAFKTIGQIALNVCGFVSIAVKNAIGIIGDVISVIVGIVTGDGEKVKISFEDILNRIKNTFNNFKTTIKNIITEIWENIKEIFHLDTIKSHFESIVNSISTTFSSIKDKIKDSFQNAWNNAKSVFEDKTSFFDSVMKGITNSIKSGLNNIIDFINNAINGLNNIKIDVPDWLSEKTGIGDLSLNIPNIPRLANGGIVSQPTLAMVGEYRGATNNPEVIAPLDRLTDLISSKNDNCDIISALEHIAEILVNQKEPQVNVILSDSYISNAITRNNVRTGGK